MFLPVLFSLLYASLYASVLSTSSFAGVTPLSTQNLANNAVSTYAGLFGTIPIHPYCPVTTADWEETRQNAIQSVAEGSMSIRSLLEFEAITRWGCDLSKLNACFQPLAHTPWRYLRTYAWTFFDLEEEKLEYLSQPLIGTLPEEFLNRELLNGIQAIVFENYQKTTQKLDSAVDKINYARSKSGLDPIVYAVFGNSDVRAIDSSKSNSRVMFYAKGVLRDAKQVFFVNATIVDGTTAVAFPSQYSAVAIQTQTSGESEVYFKDFVRTPSWVGDRDATGGDCRSCHISPLLPIPPQLDVPESDPNLAKIHFINREMKFWNEKMPNDPWSPRQFAGPGIGETKVDGKEVFPTEAKRLEFVRNCLEKGKLDPTPERVTKFSKAMKCSQCHNGTSREKIYFNQKGRIGHYIEELKTMPPKVDLDIQERSTLRSCLYNLIEKTYSTWLIGPNCNGSSL